MVRRQPNQRAFVHSALEYHAGVTSRLVSARATDAGLL